jgi:hypothetical protein
MAGGSGHLVGSRHAADQRTIELVTMVKRLVAVVGLLLVGACDSPPTGPAPLPPGSTQGPGTPARVIGRVTDERGMPMAGASISSYGYVVSTVTNADGFYELSGAFGSPFGVGLFATLEGFEQNYQYAPSSAEAVQNFRLRRVVRITSEEGFTLVVDSQDSLYGAAEQYRARRVRVVAQGTGHLVVDGSSSTGHRVLLSDGDFEYFPCCPARLDLTVSTGQEVRVHVLSFSDEPAEFSITTRLEPR